MGKGIGRFDIMGELGRGAQSVVYLAFDPHLAREVAIKTLHFAHPDPQQNAALLEEARTVSKLTHPNIVTIFEAGEEDGDVFLVFEYVAGENLSTLLRRRGALPSAKAANLMSEVLDAIGHAHKHNVIHRDLKPSNILIDENGRPKVMDFGIAAHLNKNDASPTAFTGTPAYMSPEYITRHTVSAQQDVFAAGLILFEIVTGQRAIDGRSAAHIMRQIAEEGFVLPVTEIRLDDQLAGIIQRATERQPQNRYQNAQEFHQALENYLLPESSADNRAEYAGDGESPAAIDFLLRRLLHKGDFPALSESVQTINAILSSDTDSVSRLSAAILKDFALTNKLLRMVNSAYYHSSGGKISTVSRAIILLGFNAVRDIAVAGLLLEHMQNKENAWHLKEEFLHANIAGLLARNLAHTLAFPDEEQPFICAIFHNLGRFLSQYYFPEESDVVRKFMLQKKQTEQDASKEVLGVSFEALGIAIATHWGFPALITDSMRHGEPPEEDTPEAKLQALAMFSNALCEGQEDADIGQTLQRFAKALPVSEETLRAVLAATAKEADGLAHSLRINLQHSALGRFISESWQAATTENFAETPADCTLLADASPTVTIPLSDTTGRTLDPEKRANDRQAALLAGIQDISSALLMGKHQANDILRIALESMYRALEFSHVILCMCDLKRNLLQGRFGFGAKAETLAKSLRFKRDAASDDVFHAALEKGADILIHDVDDPIFAARIPAWHREQLPGKSFLLLPLRARHHTLGLIYADSDKADGIQLADKELLLLRTLRNQTMLALMQTTQPAAFADAKHDAAVEKILIKTAPTPTPSYRLKTPAQNPSGLPNNRLPAEPRRGNEEKQLNAWEIAISRTLLALLALCLALPAAGEEEGVHFQREDWEITCDNTRACRMAGYNPESHYGGNRGSVLITRAAGQDTPLEGFVTLADWDEGEDYKPPRVLTLWIDGKSKGKLNFREKEFL
ncbi:MAG: HDOD domain-containing protein [Zoogloeaceae bacterium]|nr:HDOD domain-containing protein [Zoogloeaceae bacterium]